jgi:SAM-dependent methyltransferase
VADRSERFDAAAERDYYRNAPTHVRDPEILRPMYANFLGDVGGWFDDKRVLDLGAGECLHGMFVCAACKPRLYVNLDLFHDRMALASAGQPAAPMRFVVGNCFQLPVGSGRIDVVWSAFVLLRLRPLEAVIAEIARVLGPGGRFIGAESNFWNPAVAARILRRRPGHPDWNRNDGYLSPRMLRRTFERNGFDVRLHFFWRRLGWVRNPIVSPTLGVVATKRDTRP